LILGYLDAAVRESILQSSPCAATDEEYLRMNQTTHMASTPDFFLNDGNDAFYSHPEPHLHDLNQHQSIKQLLVPRFYLLLITSPVLAMPMTADAGHRGLYPDPLSVPYNTNYFSMDCDTAPTGCDTFPDPNLLPADNMENTSLYDAGSRLNNDMSAIWSFAGITGLSVSTNSSSNFNQGPNEQLALPMDWVYRYDRPESDGASIARASVTADLVSSSTRFQGPLPPHAHQSPATINLGRGLEASQHALNSQGLMSILNRPIPKKRRSEAP